MANTFQSRNVQSNVAGNGRSSNWSNNRPNTPYQGTRAIMAPDENTGNLVLTTLAIHQLPAGTIAVVNGNAITSDNDGVMMAVDASRGYQAIEGDLLDTLTSAIAKAQGTYTCDLNCGTTFGVKEGRLIHLQPEDAKTFGVDATRCEHLSQDGNMTILEGVIGISVEAYLAIFEMAGDKVPQPVSYREAKVLDTFPFELGLALARKRDASTDFEITNRHNEKVIITAFPRGNQRDAAIKQRQSQAIASSPLAGLNTGRKA